MNTDELNRWALDVMRRELADRQSDGPLTLRDRKGHPVPHAAAYRPPLAA